MTEHKASRGWQGAVLKLLGAGDYRLTVTGQRDISPHYLRLSFDAGGMLAALRASDDVDPDVVSPTPTSCINVATRWSTPTRSPTLSTSSSPCMTACASHWARAAQPGDTIEATVLGSRFAIPEPRPAGYVIVGDSASLPAINSLLNSIGDAPARVFLEAGHDDDKDLPVALRRHHLGGPQERRRGAAGGGAVGGVRRRRPLRLGGLRQPHHPIGRQGTKGRLWHTA